jgi:hypothetical protein
MGECSGPQCPAICPHNRRHLGLDLCASTLGSVLPAHHRRYLELVHSLGSIGPGLCAHHGGHVVVVLSAGHYPTGKHSYDRRYLELGLLYRAIGAGIRTHDVRYLVMEQCCCWPACLPPDHCGHLELVDYQCSGRSSSSKNVTRLLGVEHHICASPAATSSDNFG